MTRRVCQAVLAAVTTAVSASMKRRDTDDDLTRGSQNIVPGCKHRATPAHFAHLSPVSCGASPLFPHPLPNLAPSRYVGLIGRTIRVGFVCESLVK